MTDLPELHGWLPARDLARRLGVSSGTIRRRADRGLIEAVPNPVGPGALFRVPPQKRHTLKAPGGSPETEILRRFSAATSPLSRDDRVVLAVLPASGTWVAGMLGIPPGTAHRRLTRLEKAGLVTRGEPLPRGGRVGRPEFIWELAD